MSFLEDVETAHRDTYVSLENYLSTEDDELLVDFIASFNEYITLLSIDDNLFSDELDDEIAMLEAALDDEEYGKLRFYLGGSPDLQKAADNYEDQLPAIILSLI